MADRLEQLLRERGILGESETLTERRWPAGQGFKLGTLLLREGRVDRYALAMLLSEAYGLPTVSPDVVPEPAALDLFPDHVVRDLGAVPLRIQGDTLYVAVADPGMAPRIEQAMTASGLRVVPHVVTEPDLHRLIHRGYGLPIPPALLPLLPAPRGARPSTLSAHERFARARDRDDVVTALLDHAMGYLPFCALFVRRRHLLHGWDARGPGIGRDRLRALDVSLDAPTIFRSVSRAGSRFVGHVGSDPNDERLLRALGRAPGPVLLIPIMFRERLACLFYGDNGGTDIGASVVREVERAADDAAAALARLILDRKGGRIHDDEDGPPPTVMLAAQELAAAAAAAPQAPAPSPALPPAPVPAPPPARIARDTALMSASDILAEMSRAGTRAPAPPSPPPSPSPPAPRLPAAPRATEPDEDRHDTPSDDVAPMTVEISLSELKRHHTRQGPDASPEWGPLDPDDFAAMIGTQGALSMTLTATRAPDPDDLPSATGDILGHGDVDLEPAPDGSLEIVSWAMRTAAAATPPEPPPAPSAAPTTDPFMTLRQVRHGRAAPPQPGEVTAPREVPAAPDASQAAQVGDAQTLWHAPAIRLAPVPAPVPEVATPPPAPPEDDFVEAPHAPAVEHAGDEFVALSEIVDFELSFEEPLDEESAPAPSAALAPGDATPPAPPAPPAPPPAARPVGDSDLVLGNSGLDLLFQHFPGSISIPPAMPGQAPPAAEAHGWLLRAIVDFGPSAAPRLLPLLEHPDARVRYHAALCFGSIHHAAAVTALARHVTDPDPSTAWVCEHVLDRYRDDGSFVDAAGYLQDLLESPDPSQRSCAARLVGRFRVSAVMPALIRALNDPIREVADTAEAALVLITRQRFGRDATRWQRWWEKIRMHDRASWLVAGLRSEDREVRRDAIAELKRRVGDDYGYDYDDALDKRERAAQRWVAWWAAQTFQQRSE